MEGLGEYVMAQGNPVLRATNQSRECVFLMVNRILSSHSDIRAPIISVIVTIRALGKSFFKQLLFTRDMGKSKRETYFLSNSV